MRYTKITATIGPSCETQEKLNEMAKAGVNVYRLNFSHDKQEAHGAKITKIRKLKVPAAIIADLQGPKHRIGDFITESVVLKPGSTFIFDNNSAPGDNTRVYLPDDEVRAALKAGDTILLNDGKQEFKVLKASKTKLEAKVIRGGEIKGRRGFNLPDTEINAPILTKKDISDLEYALTKDIDYVAVSFVQKAEDIIEARNFINARTKRPIKIIAKIERPQAIARIVDIIQAVDAIMIARGDLAVEFPFYQVPAISRKIIRLCRVMNKPVIMATQMLGSMLENEFPTRAEISDVATASYIRADSSMTSEETSVGDHPALVIRTMAAILQASDEDGLDNYHDWSTTGKQENAWSKSVAELARLNEAKAIVIFTDTGENTRTISSRRPDIPIIAVCREAIIANQLCLHRGVIPILDKKIFKDQDFKAAAKMAGIKSAGYCVIVHKASVTLGKV